MQMTYRTSYWGEFAEKPMVDAPYKKGARGRAVKKKRHNGELRGAGAGLPAWTNILAGGRGSKRAKMKKEKQPDGSKRLKEKP